MKSKTTKVRRYLAAILTVLMVFQQATTSVIYASSEAAVPTVTEAPAAQTEEIPEKQVEETPEEKTPTEGENEGEKSAAPTEAPAENEAEPEVTVTPAAEPTATEAPAVEATATPVPEATPTEVPTAASFTTADGIASVNLTQPIPANAKFVATAQDADSDYFYNNVDAAMGAWVESNGLSVVDATAYDMHFEADGQELAVNQSATVHINFPAAILTQKPETGIQTTYYVLHIKNGTAVPAGTVNGDASGAYSADITTDGFSPFVFVKAASEDAIQTAVTTDKVVDVMTSVEIKGVGEGQSYNPDSENEREGSFKIVINFKEDDLRIQFARTMTYQIPQVLNITPISGKKIISNDNGKKVEIGTYDIDSNGLVTIKFNDKIDQNDAYSAYIDFEASFKTESIGKKNEYTVEFGHEIIKTFKFKPFETVTVTKTSTVDENDPTLFHYTVKVKAGETGATDVVLTDEMNGNVKLNGKFYKNGQEITHEKDQYNEKYTIKLGNLNPNEEVNITYDGKIPDDKLDNLNGEIDVYNKVVGKSSYSKETSVDVNNKYKYELLNKTDAKISEDKKTATWTITVNEGGNGNKLNLNGYTLIDNLENSNSAYKVDTTKPLWVTKDNGTPEKWDWSRVTLKAENSGWEYTFAEDTTGTYKFTYSTTVPSNESLNNLTIKNKASLKKDNKGPEKESSGTISNVGLPEDIIEKQDGQLVVDPDDATRYIKWIVNVKIPKSGYNNFWLEDSVQACYEGKAELQVTSIKNTDNPDFNEVGITSTNSALNSAINEWSLQRPDDARFFIKAKDGNNITLPAAENDYTVSIVYYTKMTSSGFESKNPLKNTATVHAENLQKSDEGQYTPDNTNSYIVKKSGYKAEDKKMCWTILLNSGAKQWGEGNYSIVDTFDNNQELDKSSIKVELGYSEYNFSNDAISAYNVSVSENSFTINFTDLKTLSETTIFENKPCPVVKITYSTKLKDSVFANENKTDVNNKFVLKKEDKVIESANSRIEVGPFKPFEKKLLTEASGSNGFKATYEMTANPNQVYLSQSSTVDKPEDYVITDTLLSNMHYDANSLVVKKNDSEINQSEYTATYENNVLTINIPNGDGKKYTITYDVYIKGEAGKEVTYKNSAVLQVKEKRYTQITDEKKVKIQNTSAGASSKSYTISLEKWNENYTQKLQAKFTLSRYSNGNWVESRDITTGTQNAVSLGTVHKQNAQDILYADCLYKLEEVEAPKDYVKSDKPYYFVIVEGTRNVEVPSNENITYDSYIASENADGSWTIKDAIRLTNKKNENPTGSLTVEKHVTGNAGDKEKEFIFEVRLTDTNINGTYGDMTFASGIASFTLKDGESKTAKNLPNGIGYSVSEKDYSGYGYATTKTGETGTIAGGSSQTASFTNTRNIGSLTVSKTLAGNAVENDRYFKFEIQVEPKLDGTYSDVTFKEGKAEIQLKGGEEKVIEGLPDGTTYSVSEKDADGYEVSKSGETGSISQEKSSVAAFTNTRNTYGSLTVEKHVTGNAGDTKKEFRFEVVLTDTNINGTYGDMTFASGIASFTLKDGESKTAKDLPNGIGYSVSEEDYSGDGYATTKTGEVGNIVGNDIQKSKFINTRNTPDTTSITVTKAWVDNDNKGNKRPSEIKVQLYADGRENGSPVTLNEANKWTYTWTGLDEKNSGTTIAYTVKEVGTVDGYEASVSGDARTGYTITNTLKSGTLEIIKSITGDVSDSALTAEQKAAMTFTVTGPDGYSETVHYSDFANGKYTFQNLPLGEYTVTETNADMEGYKLTTTYSVDGGKVTVTNKETASITITNNYVKTKDVSVKISKVDADTYEVLGGAHLQVIDPDGKVVAEWDSDKAAYTLTDLKPGVVYTLHETAAPKGYKVAEDTTFQLNEDGTIDTENTTTAISDDTLLVKDEKKESKDVSVSVTKKLVTVDGTVIGAMDATYYVALYSDADCTQRVSDVLALNFKNASSSTVTFTGLEKGQTYYVGECEADGTCYLANICADGTMYMVDFSDGNAVTVDNADGSTTVYFDNQFENIPDGYYKEAELNITKKLVGSDGKAKNSNEIFYAGIFADEGFTQLSTDVSANIVPLDLAGGSEATAQVNVALPESGSITLYVTEVDSNGKPVAGAASFKYDVTVDNTQVTLNDDNLSANVVITNKENSTKVTPTPGTPNTPNTTGGFSGKSAVRTGDSTPIGGFIALFAAAAVIAGVAVFFKRRRKDEK